MTKCTSSPSWAHLSWPRLPAPSLTKQRKPQTLPGALPAFTSPTSTYIPLYTAFPCWFCNRVLARSMGNTQVTPTSPATPPLMSFAAMLGPREGGGEEETWCERGHLATASFGRGHESRPGQRKSGMAATGLPALSPCPLPPPRLGTSFQEAHVEQPERLALTG